MKLLVKEIHITKPPGKSWAVPLVGALFIAVLCQPVAAVEQDLLDVGASGWVPLEQFTVFKVNPNDWEKPENFSGKDQKTAEASQNETTPPAAEPSPAGAPAQPALKPLSRSLNLPIMPGLNKDAASDQEPFEFNTGGWVSYERYTDKVRRFAVEPAKDTEVASATETPAASEPVPQTAAEPSRPLNLPVMPGLGQGYEIKISSTEDDDAGGVLEQPNRPLNLPVMPGLGQSMPVQGNAMASNKTNALGAQLTGLATQPELQLAGSLWQDAKSAASLTDEDEEGSESKRTPLSVRLANLPDSRITPIPEGSVIKPHSPTPAKVAAKSKRNPEVCAAITAYKKQQLAAIESDRQTLNALQAAIADLGLDKKLDFMHGARGSLAVPAADEGGQAEPGKTASGNKAPAASVGEGKN